MSLESPEMDDFEKRQEERATKILNSHAAQLGEHFDTVQIIVTRYCPETGTNGFNTGQGNWYARIASVKEWINGQKKK